MPLDWKTLWRVNPDDLPRQEELADDLLVSLSKVEVKDLKDENQENVVHLFQITQSLMKMKAQEAELALEEVEKAGEEQAKFENQLKTKVMKLENELEMAQQSAGGRDTRFLRDEIRELEKQLEQKDRELEDMEKEMEKEKKVNEQPIRQLALRNEEAENENSKLRREVGFYLCLRVKSWDSTAILPQLDPHWHMSGSLELKEIADIAKTQVEALSSHQQSREKEVESLRMQVLDYQAQSDEKALIAKLHQHIVALQMSEATSVSKLESVTSQLQKMETYKLRLEQKLDEKEQSLYFARLEGRNRAKHLRSTIQALRRQFSGALPLAQQEKFSKTMIQLQNDKLQVMQEVRTCQEERRTMENKTLELELKLKGLEELISTLKDARGAQKVIGWHMKIEELHLQELKLNREFVKDKEEIKYLKNVISEYERTISNLEEEIVQQNKIHEEQQMTWDQREVELERQLDIFDSQQNEILNAAQKFEEATGSIPDPRLPLSSQLEIALRKIKQNVQKIMETQATCKLLEEKLKEKESALRDSEQNVLSRDRIINELRLRLPATAERERLMAQLNRKEEEPESHRVLKVAHQAIANMQARLNQKEEVLKKYQDLLEKAREEQREIIKKHQEDIFILHQKLDLQADSSLSKFKQTAMELMKQSSVPVDTSKHFTRLAEMEQTLAEQDNCISSLLIKMKKMTHEIDKQKQITLTKVKEFESTRTRLEENHAEIVKKLQAEIEDLKYSMSQTERELQHFKSEVQVQKEANTRAPTATMKNLVERLKSQLALKEKQQKALSRALFELRTEMTAAAEKHIILSTSKKKENLNVQEIVDHHTRDLQIHIEDLNENLLKCKEALKTSKSREDSLNKQLDCLNNEMQKKEKGYHKILREKEELEKEYEKMKKLIKTFGLQSGRSGKTIPELEKIVGLMKKVVDKVQKENEYLKQASGIMTSEKMSALELENKNLKSELEKLKLHLGRQLSLQYEFNAKGPENVMAEIDSLRKELKKKVETSEMLRMEKNNLEISFEKLTAELEEMRKRMHQIESRNLPLERVERQSLKSVIDTRLTTDVEKTKTKLVHQAGTSQEQIEEENVVSGQ
ncbi:centrosomal protein of 290 kDa-like [Antechinus flavipes]|uniref:centrosomal protein of 290 kDa-like n=1 Tax=Antechinus flavipes TaxID=38775 RepID=UPI0022359FE5|nr:centrosomal protein of 290 kDa-like [Antechinus flavipes]